MLSRGVPSSRCLTNIVCGALGREPGRLPLASACGKIQRPKGLFLPFGHSARTIVTAQPTVPLHYEVVHSPMSNDKPTTTTAHSSAMTEPQYSIFLHGLLGYRWSLRRLAALLFPPETSSTTALLVDQRNHGKSPHADSMTPSSMAADIVALMDRLEIPEAAIIGHSLGGRVAMSLALMAPERVNSVTVLDIAPIYRKELLDEKQAAARTAIYALLTLLETMPLHTMRTRQEAKQWLIAKSAETREAPFSEGFLQFILQNLRIDDTKLSWYPNLSTLRKTFYNEIMEWPFENGQYTRGPAVFLRGSQSPWVQEAQVAGIQQFFPRYYLDTVDNADHWLHRDCPEIVAEKIRKGWSAWAFA